MFEYIVQLLIIMFDSTEYYYDCGNILGIEHVLDADIIEEQKEEAYFYVAACYKNYGNRHVLKIGFSKNVEENLCQHLSHDVQVIENLSFKIPLSLEEAMTIKKEIKDSIQRFRMTKNRNFPGRTDWFILEALPTINSILQLRFENVKRQEINWKQMFNFKEKRDVFRNHALYLKKCK